MLARRRSVRRICKDFRTSGSSNAIRAPRARRKDSLLTDEDIAWLISRVADEPDCYMDELLSVFCKFYPGRPMSISTITRALWSRGLTLKKISKAFKLRSLPERITYCVVMLSGLPLDHYLWVDETWVDRRTAVRPRARSKRGSKAIVNGIFCRGKRQNVLSTPFIAFLFVRFSH